jgi:hypothetical protein
MTTDELGPIAPEDATDLLTRTVSNNLSGMIGSVSGDIYTLTSAVALIERGGLLIRDRHLGFDLISIHVPGHGAYALYLNLDQPPKINPWS